LSWRAQARTVRLSEARTGKRFPLTLPITLKNRKSGKARSATTSNVSGAGVFIQADAKLEIGSKIEFDIILPGKIVGTDCDVEVVCKGRVIRAEIDKRPNKKSTKKQNGIACVIDHYKFVRKP
jgi:PilZ domain